MEGLVAASSRATPVRIHLRQKQLSFVSAPLVQFTRRLYRNRGQVGMRQHPKLQNLIAASAQPLEATLSPYGNRLPSKEVLDVWRNAEAVCFDVDSTVCLDEGIDELAEHCGAGKAVAEWMLGQWVVQYLLRRLWLLDYLCSNLPYLKFKIFSKRTPQNKGKEEGGGD